MKENLPSTSLSGFLTFWGWVSARRSYKCGTAIHFIYLLRNWLIKPETHGIDL